MKNVIHVANRHVQLAVWDHEFVHASDKASVYAGGGATVVATDDAYVVATDRATVLAFGKANVTASGNAHVIAHDRAFVLLRARARAEVYGDDVIVVVESQEAAIKRSPQPDVAPDLPQSTPTPGDEPPTAA